MRDYIYVEDLARAHVATLDVSGYEVFNVGSEDGTKVIDIISACERVLGEKAADR